MSLLKMTITCPVCDNRPFSNKEALLQHVKSSSSFHPACEKCDRRFTSQTALEAHISAKHPVTYDCMDCGRSYHASFALEDHYRGSSAHPNCLKCGRGFKDGRTLEDHFLSAHPKVPCGPCHGILLYADDLERHYWDSGNHPSCTECKQGFKDEDAFRSHDDDVHINIPEPAAISEEKEVFSGDSEASIPSSIVVPEPTGFTPLSPISYAQSRIVGLAPFNDRISSPDIHLNPRFSSPLTEVKPLGLSPTSPSLPKPADDIEKIWSAKENTVVPPTARSMSSLTLYQSTTPDGRSILPSQSRFFTSITSSSNVERFNSRLYPGSVRHALRTGGGLSRSAPLPEPQYGYRHSNDYSLLPRRSIAPYQGTGSVSGGSTASSSIVVSNNYNRLRGGSLNLDNEHSSRPISVNRLHRWEGSGSILSGNTERASLFSETLVKRSSMEASPTSDSSSTLTYVGTQNNPLTSSPSVSSPASSTSIVGPEPSPKFNSQNEPDGTSTSGSLEEIRWTIIPSSECSSPHSPEVSSPIGLGILPSISPIATTPIESSTDIPEARKALPDSPPEGLSPVTVVQELKSEVIEIEIASLPASPAEPISKLNHLLASPITPASESRSPIGLVRTISTSSSSGKNPLHCRGCLADSCDDITATMCGHIFCNRCITSEVIKNSRCPVCQTPTLLYCLFRLDLAA